jgi:Tfp pilus assembly protein PilF
MHRLQIIAAGAALLIMLAVCVALYRSNTRNLRFSMLMVRGVQLAKDGRDLEAMKQFEQALQIDPLSSEAHVEAARHAQLSGYFDQAERHYKKALEIKPDAAVHVALGYLYLAIATDPGESDQATSFDKARAEMDKASKMAPASPDADAGRGDIETSREKYSDAEKDYRQAIQKDPKWRDAYIGLAYVHLHRGETDQAIHDAQKGVELGSEAPISHNVLAEAFFWKGDDVRAAAEYNRAIGLTLTKAAADSKGAFELNKAKYDSHVRLGDVYYLERDYDLAREEYDQALKLARSWNYNVWVAEASSGLGYVALKQQKPEAVDRFSEALQWDRENANAHFGIGIMFARLEDQAENSAAHWNEALELHKGADPLERMERVVCKVALGAPGNVEEMSAIIREHPPIGMMHVALDDADSLIASRIHPEESEKIRDMLMKAIEQARGQPAKRE